MRAPISNVGVHDRIRIAEPETVRALAESMSVVGLLNPITVSETMVIRDGRAQPGYVLIAGLNRLEAAKSLGWTEIDVHVVPLDGWHAVLAECDENLRGPHLTPSERALFTRKRKEAYEALHPETRHGSPGVSRQVGDTRERTDCERFTADTATNTGQSERAVQRDAQRGEKIAREVLEEVRGTDLDKGVVLDRLAKAPSPAAELAAIKREREMQDVRKINRETDKLIVERRMDAIKEYLAARLDVDELHTVGEMMAGICDPLSMVLMREAA